MTPVIDPNVVAKRLLQRAHNRDGLPEIAVGLMFLVSAGLIYAEAAVASSFLLPVLILGSPWALRAVRRRYLIERSGYVQHKPIGRRRIAIGVLLAVLLSIALFGVVPGLSRPDGWLLAGTGLLGGALTAWCGRLPRFVMGGSLMAATGVVLAFSGISLQAGFAILFGFQGLVTLLSGGAVFLRFIRQPVEAGE